MAHYTKQKVRVLLEFLLFLLNIITCYLHQFNQFSEHLSDIIRDGDTS